MGKRGSFGISSKLIAAKAYVSVVSIELAVKMSRLRSLVGYKFTLDPDNIGSHLTCCSMPVLPESDQFLIRFYEKSQETDSATVISPST
ncbi:hypothetical protein RRG08_022259 [Elysia crispata]|uniref:Uncharacterized protein n=1 Tax=Elysia crispata TaxID=231223 RepID=A0AAE1DL94_9GAST|nr:hypothetical protein RRG08_022259 [Elysia crispata]